LMNIDTYNLISKNIKTGSGKVLILQKRDVQIEMFKDGSNLRK